MEKDLYDIFKETRTASEGSVSFADALAEVAQPSSEDEKHFKEKHIIHVIDYPADVETQFKGFPKGEGDEKKKKNQRNADYPEGADSKVYEGTVTISNSKHGTVLPDDDNADLDHDGDHDIIDHHIRRSNRSQFLKKIVDESVPPSYYSSSELDDALRDHQRKRNAANSDEERDFHSNRVDALRKEKELRLSKIFGRTNEECDPPMKSIKERALEKLRMRLKEAMGTKLEVPTAVGGEFDEEESHRRYKKSNMNQRKSEVQEETLDDEVNDAVNGGKNEKKEVINNFVTKAAKKQVTESFSTSLKLKDGSSFSMSQRDAALLNKMFSELNPANRKKMEAVLLADKHGAEEILSLAKEAE